MHKLRWIVLSLMGWMLLLSCSAETPTAATVAPPTAAPTEAVAEPTIAAASESDANAEAALAPQGVTLSGYTNVRYTQDNADLLGTSNRAQLLNVYATW